MPRISLVNHTVGPLPRSVHNAAFTSENACDAVARRDVRKITDEGNTNISQITAVSQKFLMRHMHRKTMSVQDTLEFAAALGKALVSSTETIHAGHSCTHDRVRRKITAQTYSTHLIPRDEGRSVIEGMRWDLTRSTYLMIAIKTQISLLTHAKARYMHRARRPINNLLAQMSQICALIHSQDRIYREQGSDRLLIALPEGILFVSLSQLQEGWHTFPIWRKANGNSDWAFNIESNTKSELYNSASTRVVKSKIRTFYGEREIKSVLEDLHRRLTQHQNTITQAAELAFRRDFLGIMPDLDQDAAIKQAAVATQKMANHPAWKDYIESRQAFEARFTQSRRS